MFIYKNRLVNDGEQICRLEAILAIFWVKSEEEEEQQQQLIHF